MRMLIWIPLATILGLSLSLAILLARPAAPTIVLTIVTPAAAPAPVIKFTPNWTWPYAYAPCNAWSRICP
jgi:hypothetical protein